MTLLSSKFPFVREEVATDDGISAKTRRRGREGEGEAEKDASRTHMVALISYPDPTDCNFN